MSTPAVGRNAEWFFDFVSPFAYLQLEQFDTLPATLVIEPTPIVLGALLAHWGQKGPAEIAAKRVFTYRHALYRAQRLGIAYRMPDAHPFNPIKALRLAIAMGGTLDVIRRIFRHIWRDGHDVASPEGFAALCEAMRFPQGVHAVEDPAVKEALRRNTERAISLEVFGVPTFALDGELFWGEDATALFVECVRSNAWLDSPEVRRVSALPVGVQRGVAPAPVAQAGVAANRPGTSAAVPGASR
ncbi:2-hydroxychromene-2-carboxylate isomerase [Trinickia dabaoshanensis]|uniref:2-hydroxychromene-2-carboxylate isomerase n=1 Tax=Trinickia dabaoshanensis TaxID=564714 RepID=A0A2N7VH48_9BURK|nr:2-hydroxychromene-2-carboxylate isomerase [Trinickia dabaoshanensis]